MAPIDAAVPVLSLDPLLGPGPVPAPPNGWPQDLNCIPGYSCSPSAGPDGGKALLSTSVLNGRESCANFTVRSGVRTSSIEAVEKAGKDMRAEEEKLPYRPGEVLKSTANPYPPFALQDVVAAAGALLAEPGVIADAKSNSSIASSSDGSVAQAAQGVLWDLCKAIGERVRQREAIPGTTTVPLMGTPQLPTVGSLGHWIGTCKPCAFAFKGCQSGVGCQFCHLCLPGEKRRRRKASKLAHMANQQFWMQKQG